MPKILIALEPAGHTEQYFTATNSLVSNIEEQLVETSSTDLAGKEMCLLQAFLISENLKQNISCQRIIQRDLLDDTKQARDTTPVLMPSGINSSTGGQDMLKGDLMQID